LVAYVGGEFSNPNIIVLVLINRFVGVYTPTYKTEESVYNALFAAESVDNKNGKYKELPVNKTLEIIEGYKAVSR